MAASKNVTIPQPLLASFQESGGSKQELGTTGLRGLHVHLRECEWREMIEEAGQRTARLGIKENEVNDLIADFRIGRG